MHIFHHEIQYLKREFVYIMERQQVENIFVDYYACDLVNDNKQLYEYCHQKGYEVTGLVNNAGYGDYGSFIDGDIDIDY